jgi:hypothetical protein
MQLNFNLPLKFAQPGEADLAGKQRDRNRQQREEPHKTSTCLWPVPSGIVSGPAARERSRRFLLD